MRLLTLFGSALAFLLLAFTGIVWETNPTYSGALPSSRDTIRTDTISSARISLGAELFSRTCQRCHSPRGPGEYADREWVVIMQHMQTRANLTREQTALVRDFLLASNGPAMAPGSERPEVQAERSTFLPSSVTSSMVQRGRKIYRGAGGCAACHGENLRRGPVAPSLRDDRWRNGDGSLASILNTIRNGVQGTAMAAYPGGISDDDAKAVAAYVWQAKEGEIEP